MNFSRVSLTFALCFAYFASTSSDQTFIQKLNEDLLQPKGKNNHQLYLKGTAFLAASAGKNVFNLDPLSEDCVRTSRVAFDLFVTPSAWHVVKSVLEASENETIAEIRSGKNTVNPTEVFCQHINQQFAKRPDFSHFEDLKKKVDLPKPTKNYFIEIQPGKSIGDLLGQASTDVDDPEFFQYTAITHFQNYEYLGVTKHYAKFVGVGKAIHQLSEQKTTKATVDAVFHQAFDDYIKQVRTKYSGDAMKIMKEIVGPTFAEKVDEYFRKNAALKEEYEKIQKAEEEHVLKTAKF